MRLPQKVQIEMRFHLLGAKRLVRHGHHPLRSALKRHELRDTFVNRRNDLHARRARTHNPNPSTVDCCIVVPTGTVKRSATERVEAVDVGQLRMVQHPSRRNYDIHNIDMTTASLQIPATVEPFATHYLIAEARTSSHVVLLRNPLKIRLYLRARRVGVRPLGIRCERIAVQLRRNVTTQSRIRIFSPRAADSITFFVDGEIGEAGFGELDRAEDPGHSGTDDREPQRPERMRWMQSHGNITLGRIMTSRARW